MNVKKYKQAKQFHISLNKKTLVCFKNSSILVQGVKGTILKDLKICKNNYFIVLGKFFISFYQKNYQQQQVIRNLEIYNLISNFFVGVAHLFSKKLIFVGVGFKTWVKKLKKQKILLLKVGFSEDLCIAIPKNILVYPLKPTLLLIRGLHKKEIYQFAGIIKQLKQPDIYKGKGIQFAFDKFLLKQGKKLK